MASLHVILARESTRAIIFRRGPSNRWAFIGWDRRDDSFQLGQWIKGRLHPKRSDLSPDGKHILYFHCDYRFLDGISSWTAISRWPYVTAVSFHPYAASFHGGGLWIDNKRYWLNDWDGNLHRDAYLDASLTQVMDYDPGHPQYGEDMSVYIPRLNHAGWTFQDAVARHATRQHVEYDKLVGFKFTKRYSKAWSLELICHCDSDRSKGDSSYWDEYSLLRKDGTAVALPDWDWGDVDGDRLVWSEAGRLFAGFIDDGGSIQSKLLGDFTDMKFEPIEPPYERKRYVEKP